MCYFPGYRWGFYQFFFFFQAEDGIRDDLVTGVQTCALPIFPQLVLVDGGRGQLNCAYQALCDLGLEHTIELAGMAIRLGEILSAGDPVSNFLDKNSPALKLLMQLRDEAHRFGITHHRSKRTKAQTVSELSMIPGIGEITEQKLLLQYKSVKRIKTIPFEELVAFAGRKVATAVKTYFNL